MIRLLDAPAVSASPCGDIAARIFEYLDGELVPDDSAAVRRHLARCPRCCSRAERERHFLDVVGERTRIERAPWGLRRRVLATMSREAGPRRQD